MKSENIKTFVENYFDRNITRKTRKKEYVFARMVYYALCERFTTDESGVVSARILGFDHATRLHALHQFNEYYGKSYFKLYTEGFNYIEQYILDNELNKPQKRIKTVSEIEEEYKLRFIKIVEKGHRVIANLKRKSKLYEEDEVFQELFDLPENDLQEFKQLAKVFLKRKKREREYF